MGVRGQMRGFGSTVRLGTQTVFMATVLSVKLADSLKDRSGCLFFLVDCQNNKMIHIKRAFRREKSKLLI